MPLTKITNKGIADDSITSDKVADGVISAADVADGTITNAKLAGSIANDKLSNTSITINGTSIALGASGNIVAGTDWQAVITADGSTFNTASAGQGFFIDTTSAAHTITLPASPTQGDEVTIVDYAGTFGTNNVTVARNGSNIDGTASDGTLSTNRLNVRFVYIDATQGWKAVFDEVSTSYGASYIEATGGTETTSGNFKIHTFTGDGCFQVTKLGNPAGSTTVDYLVIAGGGSGGADAGGGGGAGGYRFSNGTASGCYTAGPSPLGASALPVSVTTYPITVGGGGGAVTSGGGNVGSNSVFSTITSAGGGGGASGPAAADTGGSGGGGKANNPCGAAGNTPPVSPPQGNPGGNGPGSGAGGGGAGAAGCNGSPAPGGGGDGGDGLTSSITGSPVARGGGGGGGADYPGFAATCGGSGGGGAGQIRPKTGAGGSGTANTGGGGGGSGVPSESGSGAGGQGVVIIRYKFQ